MRVLVRPQVRLTAVRAVLRGGSVFTHRSHARSYQCLFIGPGDPLGEPLAVLALRIEGFDDAFDVIGQVIPGHLVPADLATEAGVQPEAAAQVHLEPLDLGTAGIGDDHALEADVGDLASWRRHSGNR